MGQKTIARIKTESGGRFRVRRWTEVHSTLVGTYGKPASLDKFDGDEWNRLETWDSWHNTAKRLISDFKTDEEVLEEALEKLQFYDDSDVAIQKTEAFGHEHKTDFDDY